MPFLLCHVKITNMFSLNPMISEHCYTNLWICGSITVICALQTGKLKALGCVHLAPWMSVPCGGGAGGGVWSKAGCCSALLGQLHCSSWGKQGTSDFSRTDGFRGLLRRQWLRAGNSGWKDLNGDETILFMIKGPKQWQSCGKWISVYLTPDLNWNLVPHKHPLLGTVHPK